MIIENELRFDSRDFLYSILSMNIYCNPPIMGGTPYKSIKEGGGRSSSVVTF